MEPNGGRARGDAHPTWDIMAYIVFKRLLRFAPCVPHQMNTVRVSGSVSAGELYKVASNVKYTLPLSSEEAALPEIDLV